jgi:hypothetical protein
MKLKNKINQEKDKKQKKYQSKEWWLNWIKKLNKIKCQGMKSKNKKTSKNIKRKTNSNKKIRDQNWYKYKLTGNI